MAAFGKAQYIARVEDDRLLTGTGGFTDNLTRANQAHVTLVRSPHAHARIVKIDTAAALKAPGVVAVYHLGRYGQVGLRRLLLSGDVPGGRRQQARDDSAPLARP